MQHRPIFYITINDCPKTATYLKTHAWLFFCCALLFTVLKRGKAKKGKNDLIGAEEGEDPFADISSVGKSRIFLSTASSRAPVTFTCRSSTRSTFTIKAAVKARLHTEHNPFPALLTLWLPFVR